MENIAGCPPLLEVLSAENEIEAAIGKPTPRILAKVVDTLDDYRGGIIRFQWAL